MALLVSTYTPMKWNEHSSHVQILFHGLVCAMHSTECDGILAHPLKSLTTQALEMLITKISSDS